MPQRLDSLGVIWVRWILEIIKGEPPLHPDLARFLMEAVSNLLGEKTLGAVNKGTIPVLNRRNNHLPYWIVFGQE